MDKGTENTSEKATEATDTINGRVVLVCKFVNNNEEFMPADVSLKDLYGTEYEYYYVPEKGKTVQKGDFAVVLVRGRELKIVKVVSVRLFSSKATHYAITTFRLDEYQERVEKAKRAEELRDALYERVKWVREKAQIESFASEDAEVQRLLTELKSLEG